MVCVCTSVSMNYYLFMCVCVCVCAYARCECIRSGSHGNNTFLIADHNNIHYDLLFY